MRILLDLGAGARRGGVVFVGVEGRVAGDHARREFRVSWEGGSGILRRISRDVRSRI
jgi:hypothetical protein